MQQMPKIQKNIAFYLCFKIFFQLFTILGFFLDLGNLCKLTFSMIYLDGTL